MLFGWAAELIAPSQFAAHSTREESENELKVQLSRDHPMTKWCMGRIWGHQGGLSQPWQLSGLWDPTGAGSSSGLQELGGSFVFHLIRVVGSA